MARSFARCLGLCILGFASGQGFDCPMPDDTSVGSCWILGCYASRGPTRCSWGSCFCAKGYCKTPAGPTQNGATTCVAPVPDLLCKIGHVCYAEASFCEQGRCLCRPGYEVEQGTQRCVPATTALAELIASNATEGGIELSTEHFERVVVQNIAIGAASLCGAAMLILLASGALRRRASTVAAQSAGYHVLVS